MSREFSRRDFLRLATLSLGGLAFRSVKLAKQDTPAAIGRVAYEFVSVFDAPLLEANTLGYRFRDELLDFRYALHPLAGPAYNPLWYRIDEGYVHSAFIQPVKNQINQVMANIPEAGQLCRVTVPFTQPYNYSSQTGWQVESRFRLYYESNHWVTGIVAGPDGEPWYQITESWEGTQYYAKANHLQKIPDEELAPISAGVSPGQKRIEISLKQQTLTAYENNHVVLRTPISSGIQNSGAAGLPTETPKGDFNIYSKLPAKYMGDNRLTDNLSDHFLPGVPWTAFFHEGGYAIHGAYWHDNFGAPMSKGCINVQPKVAQWLYRWTTPVAGPGVWEVPGNGTRVIVK